MPILFVKKESEERAEVQTIHNAPELLSEEKKTEGIEVPSVPEYEEQFGKESHLYVNPTTKELWYEFTDRPLTMEEKMEKMEASQLQQDELLMELMLGGM